MTKNAEREQTGFSAIEVLVAIAIISVVLVMALLNWTTLMPNIAHRHFVQVQFVGTNQLTISELWAVGTPPPPVTYTFEGGAQFMVFAGVPDTPMGFGNSSPVLFENVSGGPPTMQFNSTGAFVDAGNTLVNGTVFLGISGVPRSARAITILGATGRVREYHYDGTQWQE